MDDCGPQINPMIVEGQVHGGVVQGIGQALWEEAVYDDNGQLLTGSLADYAIPRADVLPEIEVLSTVTPSPHHPLGVKGIGEAGTIASTCTVYNAVIDALAAVRRRDRSACRSRPSACGAPSTRTEGSVDMYAADFDYYRARSLADAQQLLAAHPGREAAGRRPQPDAADEAAAGRAAGRRSTSAGFRSCAASREPATPSASAR